MEINRDEVAFAIDEGGYHFEATYLHEPKGQALIEITKVRTFLFPAYKIWNIAAHASDIAADLEARNGDAALTEAGSFGIGGSAYAPTLPHDAPEPER